MNKVKYAEWEHIFLDTSIVIKYLHGMRDSSHSVAGFVKRLIDDLNTTKTTKGKKRNFYISSITIGELYDKSGDTKRAENIVRGLNTKGLTFVSFDNDIAEFMTGKYHEILGTPKLKEIARELSFPEHELLHARQWIEKDVMIIASAEHTTCDVILTMDKKTMLPIANKVDYFCAVAEKDNFNCSDNYIFEYDYGVYKTVTNG